MTKRSSVSAKSPTPDSGLPVGGAGTSRSPPPAVPHSQPQSQPTASASNSNTSLTSHATRPSESTSSEKFHVAHLANPSFPTLSTSSLGESRITSPGSRTSTPESISTVPTSVTSTHVESPQRGYGSSGGHEVTPRPHIATHRHTNGIHVESDTVQTGPTDPIEPFSPPQDDTTSSSFHGLHERTYDYSEDNHRISTASDGELGIGLSLLQDLVNGAHPDDWSSTEEGDDSVNQRVQPSRTPSVSSRNDDVQHISATDPTESLRRSSSASVAHHPYHSDWEGASDIYDDYRYSRQSFASKMSRYSQSSVYTTNSVSKAPPLPTDSWDGAERKQSTDSNSPFFPTSSPSKLSNAPSHPDAARAKGAHVSYPPRTVVGVLAEQPDDPLIQATFPSPPTSPDTASTHSESFRISPKSSLSSFPPVMPTTGAALSLRQKFEVERRSPTLPQQLVGNGNIVIEDDEVPPTHDDSGVPEITHEIESASSRSSSPDLSAAPLLGPLRVTNRTPSPSPSISHAPPSPSPSRAEVGDWKPDASPSPSAPPTPVTPTFSQIPPPQILQQGPPQPAAPIAQSESGLRTGRGELPHTRATHSPSAGPTSLPLQPQSQPLTQAVPRQAVIPATQQGGPGSRRSLFLPHPNAPKPAPIRSEPMYVRRALEQPVYGPPRIPESNAVHVIRMAVAGPRGPTPLCTIYGRCDIDLSKATGPVPITFSLEPPPVRPVQVVNRPNFPSGMPRRPVAASSMPPPPSVGPSLPPMNPTSGPPAPTNSQFPSDRAPTTSSVPIPQSNGSKPPEPSTVSVNTVSTPTSKTAEAIPSSNVIPRANFTPKVQTPRPRSRSFSGFQTPSPLTTNPAGQQSVIIAVSSIIYAKLVRLVQEWSPEQAPAQ